MVCHHGWKSTANYPESHNVDVVSNLPFEAASNDIPKLHNRLLEANQKLECKNLPSTPVVRHWQKTQLKQSIHHPIEAINYITRKDEMFSYIHMAIFVWKKLLSCCIVIVKFFPSNLNLGHHGSFAENPGKLPGKIQKYSISQPYKRAYCMITQQAWRISQSLPEKKLFSLKQLYLWVTVFPLRYATTRQFAQCYLILAHFQHSKFNTLYIYIAICIALSTLRTLHCWCVCMVAQMHATKQTFAKCRIFLKGRLVPATTHTSSGASIKTTYQEEKYTFQPVNIRF